jgi:ABC-type polysaccharide/polyol phosphate transport system ATPase subunit
MSQGPERTPAVTVSGVSKTFRIPRERVHTLKERALHPFRNPGAEELRALRDVSFSVPKGQFFGIVGRNGSGKSTLLKCLAGIYSTDAGTIWIDGRMSTFIELGVGFNHELAARDNVMLNAAMLGLSPREARRRFDAVVEFAELEDFVDLKLKNYSSGMLVRLAFSVMIQVDAEILLIDEVLAVGDAAFQQKCNDEFERIRSAGKTVLLVTHDMNAVRRFCDSAMLLERGSVVATGDPETVGGRYLQLNFSHEARAAMEQEARQRALHGVEPVQFLGSEGARFGDGRASIEEAWFEDEHGTPSITLANGTRCAFAMRVRFAEDVEDPHFAVALANPKRMQLFSASTALEDPHPGWFRAGEEVVYRVRFENILGPDQYTVTAAVAVAGGAPLDQHERMMTVNVTRARVTGTLVDIPHEQELVRESGARPVAGDAPAEAAP